jgi:hypothetical protein
MKKVFNENIAFRSYTKSTKAKVNVSMVELDDQESNHFKKVIMMKKIDENYGDFILKNDTKPIIKDLLNLYCRGANFEEILFVYRDTTDLYFSNVDFYNFDLANPKFDSERRIADFDIASNCLMQGTRFNSSDLLEIFGENRHWMVEEHEHRFPDVHLKTNNLKTRAL